MHSVKADVTHNRLRVQLVGLLSDEEAREAADAVLREAVHLRPGFGVVNDVSACRPMSQAGLAEVRRAITGLAQMGMRTLVRVVGPSAIAAMQFNRESKSAIQLDAPVVSTVEEADRILDNLPARA